MYINALSQNDILYIQVYKNIGPIRCKAHKETALLPAGVVLVIVLPGTPDIVALWDVTPPLGVAVV